MRRTTLVTLAISATAALMLGISRRVRRNQRHVDARDGPHDAHAQGDRGQRGRPARTRSTSCSASTPCWR